MTIKQLIDKIKAITGMLKHHPNLSNNETAQEDNLEKIETQITEVQLLLRKNSRRGGPERPFGIEKEEFAKLKKQIKKAFGKVLLEDYKVRV
jgi:hypothetical protein